VSKITFTETTEIISENPYSLSAKMRIETALAENPNLFEAEMKQLSDMGFLETRKNLKLLFRTDGNVQVVSQFLSTKKLLKDCCKANRLGKNKEKRDRKGDRKEKKHADKGEKKQSKLAEKLAKKLEKKMTKKMSHGNNRGDPKQSKMVVNVCELSDKSSWPVSVSHVFLDGNNMLYVANAMRKFAIKKKGLAEDILTSFARRFREVTNARVTIIFDDSNKTVDEPGFSVFRARPGFATSDDALVQLAGALEEKKGSMFVTSDRELLERLEEKGVILVKPKNWMAFAAERIREVTPEEFKGVEDGLEAFLAHWILVHHPDETAGGPNPEATSMFSKMTL